MRNEFSGIARNVVQARRISGGVHFHESRPVPTGLAGLPAVDRLTGRSAELAVLAAVLSPSSEQAVCTIAGLGGVGKTTLAVHAARQAQFAGGVLFIDLHGYDSTRRVSASSALSTLSRMLGVADEHIPQQQADLEDLYRTVLSALADDGQPVLVLADNASDVSQVLPLLPGRPEHRMLVTARVTLPIPRARRLSLDVLPVADGVEVLDHALRAANPSDTRISDEPVEAAALVDLCGGLPLALWIIAQVLADHPDRPVADLVSTVADEQDRLGELAYGDSYAVRSVFMASYRSLPDEQARLFRLFAAHPGPFLDRETAAALADRPETATRRLLDGLTRAHLVREEHGWYTMHDLVLLFAVERFAEDNDESAIERLAMHYRDVVKAAVSHLEPDLASSDRFRDRAGAVAWLDAQLPNTMAVAELAGDGGLPEVVRDIGLSLVPYFDFRRYWLTWATAGELALTAARILGDATAEADALNSLGLAYQGLRGRGDDAIESLEQALAIHGFLGDRAGMAAALTNLGNAELHRGRPDEAADRQRQAAALYRQLGHRRGEAATLVNLAAVEEKRGRFREALATYRTAVPAAVASGDRHRLAATLSSIAGVLVKMGDTARGEEELERALSLHRELGDREGEAWSLRTMAGAYADAMRFDQAIDAYQRALAIFREVGDMFEESETLIRMAEIYRRADRHTEAIEHGLRAIDRHRELGDEFGVATILSYLGRAHRALGEPDTAADCFERSMAIFAEIDAPEDLEFVRELADRGVSGGQDLAGGGGDGFGVDAGGAE
ncbi:ATP-binding protein [Kutzneria chonburiensis]|uniref:Tetratricopeptide repeat protein n=1 Tax=Kutzneria chonburiensis TaxID=1483604 RepID=A0ABV6MSW2_9PSEU|nr:tetratricopeptide repeat protein [Kutzneria chonburiensis]